MTVCNEPTKEHHTTSTDTSKEYLIFWSLVCFLLKDMFLCELLQAAHGGLLELHQTLAGAGILHLDLPLTLLCRGTERERKQGYRLEDTGTFITVNSFKHLRFIYSYFVTRYTFTSTHLSLRCSYLLLMGETYDRLIKHLII